MSNQAAAITVGSLHMHSQEVGGFRVTDALFPPHLHLPSHYHPRACLAVVLEGGLDKAYRQVTQPATPLGVVTMPPEERHQDTFLDCGAHMLVVEPGPATADLLDPYAWVFECRAWRDPAIAGLAWRIQRELTTPDAVSPLAMTGLMLEMVALAARQMRDTPDQRPPPWLARVEDMLRTEFAKPVGLERVAAEVGVHPVYLARVFRLHYRVSVGDYVRRLRLDWAATRLAQTDEPLGDVALAAGFVDQSHFTRVFKHHLGLTPGQYRALRRRL